MTMITDLVRLCGLVMILLVAVGAAAVVDIRYAEPVLAAVDRLEAFEAAENRRVDTEVRAAVAAAEAANQQAALTAPPLVVSPERDRPPLPAVEPEPEPEPCPVGTAARPDCDPCPVDEYEPGAAQGECWIRAAFPPAEQDTAIRVAASESGNTWHPWIENYDQYRRETGQRWTFERARYVNVQDRRGWKVYGLFQHRWEYWTDRAAKAAARFGWGDVELDPFNGWHNVLVSHWLAGREGWRHWDVCSESAPSNYTRKFRCGPGRWLV